MKIVICGSMMFSKDMEDIAKELIGAGHKVFLPDGTGDYLDVDGELIDKKEGANKKIAKDLIRSHYNLIKESDAILVVNKDKKGIPNYIGGNSILETGFAYVLGKKIYFLQDIPEIDLINQELIAMQPIVINGDLTKIQS